jgi:SSS family solute:Na+ symporter
MPEAKLAAIDYAMLGLYAAAMLAIGYAASRKTASASEFFLAGRSMRWGVIGLALFASNISSTTLVGLAGDAYATGIAVYNYEWMAGVVLAFFAIFILPMVLRSQVYTMPEYLERRFDRRARTLFAALTLFLNIMVDTAGSLFAGALLLGFVFPGTPFWLIVAVLASITGLYTIVGGFRAVMFTEVIQAVILLAGSVLISWFALQRIEGGWAAVLAATPPEKLSLVRPLSDPNLPWLGLVTGVPLLGFYFWCTNQFMAQRMLAARSLGDARGGALFAGLLKLPVLFIMVLPGTMAVLLYPALPRADLVFPTLMFDLLPAGILGLALAGFLAALMSSIASTLNSAATLVIMDFVRPARPDLNERRLAQLGRIATFAFMLAAMLWAPQISSFPSLFKYLQQILSYAVGPVVALFLFGSFWARANAAGAFWALAVGFGLGFVLFLLNGLLPGLAAAHPERTLLVALDRAIGLDIHFLYIGPIVFAVSSLVLAAASFSQPPPRGVEAFLWRPALSLPEPGGGWWADYRVHALGLLGLTGLILAAFW